MKGWESPSTVSAEGFCRVSGKVLEEGLGGGGVYVGLWGVVGLSRESNDLMT